MQSTIYVQQQLNGLRAGLDKEALRPLLWGLADRLSSQTLGNAGLVIFGASSALAKTGATATSAVAGGVLLSIAASTSMAALSGTTSQNTFNVYCFFIDSAGTLTTLMGTQATTLAGVKFPPIPVNKAMIGFITVNPTSAAFIGGTTALDAASTNVVYVNTQGAFDPTILAQ
jgi:hypothetical protein